MWCISIRIRISTLLSRHSTFVPLFRLLIDLGYFLLLMTQINTCLRAYQASAFPCADSVKYVLLKLC